MGGKRPLVKNQAALQKRPLMPYEMQMQRRDLTMVICNAYPQSLMKFADEIRFVCSDRSAFSG